jgi:L-threonylcarbamoyladenylate synthase
VLLRPGAVTHAQIARALGMPVARSRRSPARGRPQAAPGQFERHYSPRTPVLVHSRLTGGMVAKGGPGDAWLFVARPRATGNGKNVFWLDAKGDLRRAARTLFATLRRMDEGGFSRLHAELPRGGGIAEALRDRLLRAAAGRSAEHRG